jgi:hypothetical protein
VREWIDTVTLAGSTLRVTVPEPMPADRDTLAVASAIRLFERFPALDVLVLAGGGGEVALSRADVERLMAPEGLESLRDRGRWPLVLARAIQRHLGAGAESGG